MRPALLDEGGSPSRSVEVRMVGMWTGGASPLSGVKGSLLALLSACRQNTWNSLHRHLMQGAGAVGSGRDPSS